jgi:hypothetical protein
MNEMPPAENQTPEPILRPEARVARADRSLAAMVLFVCTLGGMGIGFGSAMYLMRAHWSAPGVYQCGAVARIADATTWLGVGIRSYTGRDGTVVMRVFDDTAAQRAGLRAGDLVRRFEGQRIRSADDLVTAVRSRTPGDVVTIEVERNRQPVTLTARLGAR